jgi:glycosyltransferase involved in cell wall biosynthesis
VSLDVVLLSPGLPHHGGTLKERSLGGSETAAIMVAKHLAARGHHVTAFSPGHEGCVVDGVTWMPAGQFQIYATTTPHDVTVVSRALDAMRMPFNSSVRVLWVHDLALKRFQPQYAGVVWNLDAIYCPSAFMVRQYREVAPGLPESVYMQTRNGVDLPRFLPLAEVKRDPQKLVYGSRPERGLEACLNVMEVLARKRSPLRLDVSWYDNVPDNVRPLYEALWNRARTMPNVRLLGPLRQHEWHQHLAQAQAMLYPGTPGDFREISCIAGLEAMACGTPVVAVAKGALPETLHPACAALLGDEETDPSTKEWATTFADKVVEVTSDPAVWRAMSFAARQRATMVDWSGVAEQWEADWYRRLASRQGDARRTRLHLLREGDHEALAGLG